MHRALSKRLCGLGINKTEYSDKTTSKMFGSSRIKKDLFPPLNTCISIAFSMWALVSTTGSMLSLQSSLGNTPVIAIITIRKIRHEKKTNTHSTTTHPTSLSQ